MLDSDTEGEGDIGSTINPSVAMAIAGGPLAPGSRTSISQGPSTVSLRLIPTDSFESKPMSLGGKAGARLLESLPRMQEVLGSFPSSTRDGAHMCSQDWGDGGGRL
jgi:hypothetical protein